LAGRISDRWNDEKKKASHTERPGKLKQKIVTKRIFPRKMGARYFNPKGRRHGGKRGTKKKKGGRWETSSTTGQEEKTKKDEPSRLPQKGGIWGAGGGESQKKKKKKNGAGLGAHLRGNLE